MSWEIVNIPRNNQILAKKAIDAVNNTGAILNDGDIVLVDITADGVLNSVVAPTTLLLINTRIKAIYKGKTALATGATGRFVVKGQVKASLVTGLSASGSLMVGATAATGGTNLAAWTADANSKHIVVGFNINATVAAIVDEVWFDGTDTGYAATS